MSNPPMGFREKLELELEHAQHQPDRSRAAKDWAAGLASFTAVGLIALLAAALVVLAGWFLIASAGILLKLVAAVAIVVIASLAWQKIRG